jgi:hypothetical protein
MPRLAVILFEQESIFILKEGTLGKRYLDGVSQHVDADCSFIDNQFHLGTATYQASMSNYTVTATWL